MEHRQFNNLLEELVARLTAGEVEKLKTALDERGEREEGCILIDGHFEEHN
ncbi:MAG: hypothetical protein GY927_21295 [bacterium]|nr:hypothetical protein [bacterium]